MDYFDVFWLVAGIPATVCLAGTVAFMHGPFGLSELFRTWFVVFFGGAKWAQVGVSCIVCMSLWAAMVVAGMVSDAIGGLRWSQYCLLVLFYSGLICFMVWHLYTGFSATSKPSPPSERATRWTRRMKKFWEGDYYFASRRELSNTTGDATERDQKI